MKIRAIVYGGLSLIVLAVGLKWHQINRLYSTPRPRYDHRPPNWSKQLNFEVLGLPLAERPSSQAYKGYPWVQDFIDERKRHPSPGLTYEPFSLWKAKPDHSKFVNYEDDGYRRTINPTGTRGKTRHVFVFGGSTVAGDGILRDEDVLPSALSKILNDQGQDMFIVHNYGQSGFNQGNEVVLLTQLLAQGRIPDYVIFYDGGNDIIHRVFFGVPHMAYGDFVAVLSKNTEQAPPKALRSAQSAEMFERLTSLVDRTAGHMEIVKALSKHFGFGFRFFLQPTIFTRAHPSDEERYILGRIRKYGPTVYRIYPIAYEAFRKRFGSEKQFVDLSAALDDSKDTHYVDFLHMNPKGNQVVAAAMAKAITSDVNSSSSPAPYRRGLSGER